MSGKPTEKEKAKARTESRYTQLVSTISARRRTITAFGPIIDSSPFNKRIDN